jgi:hypothetical protein
MKPEQDYFLNPEDIQLILELIEFRFQMAEMSNDNYEDRYLAEDLYIYLKRMQLEAVKK